jgi:hypothetical protein
MASNLKFSVVVKNAQEAALRTNLGASALINIYSGTQPASPDTAITSQVLLATLTAGATFGSESGGVETLNAITAGTGSAAAGSGGTLATWFRMTTSGGTAHVDGTVGTSGCDLNLGSATISTGVQVSVSSWTLANGN